MLPIPESYHRLRPLIFGVLVLLLVGLPWLLLYRAENRSYDLTISTGQPGGIYTPLAGAIAEVVSKDHPRLSFELKPGAGA